MRKRVVTALMSIVLMAAGCSNSKSEKNTDTVQAAQVESESGHATVNTVTLTEGKYSDEDLDNAYDEGSAGKITFGTEGAVSEGSGIIVEGNNAVVTAAGTYIVTGETQNGKLTIDLKTDGEARIVLDNVSITCTDGAAIQGTNGKMTVTLTENSVNYIEDGENYEILDENDEPSAAIFSKDDLTFNGKGSLEVKANYNNAIQSKDDLKFISGTYIINAKDCGIVGKDSVTVRDGTFNITSGKDGIRASNVKESDKGYIIIDGGTFDINSVEDSVQAETLLLINDGNFTVTSGGGSENAVSKSGGQEEIRGMDGEMMKGGTPPDGETPPGDGQMPDGETPPGDGQTPDGEASKDITPPDKTQENQTEENTEVTGITAEAVQRTDDNEQAADTQEENTGSQEQQTENQDEDTTASTKALKSYVDVQIDGGTFLINACDDAIHSNGKITVNGGTFTIQAGDDGVHADDSLTINNGTIQMDKSYEGLESLEIVINNGNINITASDDGINAAGDNDTAEEPEEEEDQGFRKTGMGMDESQGASLTINGGNLTVNASGDGLDANGSIIMTDGTVTVQGPTSGGDGTFDYVDGFSLTGGTLLAVGSSGMIQEPDDTSTQPVITWTASSEIALGSEITVIDSSGKTIMKMTAAKQAQWLCLSAPELKEGETYTVNVGDTQKTVTLNSIIQKIAE